MVRALFSVGLVAGLLGAGPAAAQVDPGQIARRAVDQLEFAAEAMADAEGSRDRIAALTRTVRAYEQGLAALREGMRQASLREGWIRARFDIESDRLSALLGTLSTMQASPEALLLLHPGGAMGTARSGIILSDVTPALLAEVTELRADLTEIADLRALEADAETTLADALEQVQKARTALSLAMSGRTDLPMRVTEDGDQMDRLAASAGSLEEFADALAAMPDDDDAAAPDFARAKGDLPLPVRGRVVAGFDAPDGAGVRRPGVLLATAPGALVTAPWPATIRYRGPLADYENVMIIEPAAGYLMVLGGLSTVYGDTGQVVPADTPLGLMGGDVTGSGDEGMGKDVPVPDGVVTQAGGGDGQARRETLYLELREGQRPVDPTPWFRMDEE